MALPVLKAGVTKKAVFVGPAHDSVLEAGDFMAHPSAKLSIVVQPGVILGFFIKKWRLGLYELPIVK